MPIIDNDESNFVIVRNSLINEDNEYWNNLHGWGNYRSATIFNANILTVPLSTGVGYPDDTYGVFEFDSDGDMVGEYTLTPMGTLERVTI
jgi:hypothetical protein